MSFDLQSKQQLYSRSTIKRNLTLRSVTEAVREAFESYSQGLAQMPSKNYLEFKNFDGDLRTMSAFIPSMEIATVKIVNSHPNNPDQFNLPTVMALLVSVNPENGRPEAVMDATEITALRTAAASALASETLAHSESETLGIIGAGDQATYQVDGQLDVLDFKTVLILDKKESRSRRVMDELQRKHQSVHFTVCSESREILEQADVINSLTPSREPLIEKFSSVSYKKHLHINAMGADGGQKQEWPLDLYEKFIIFIDDWDQAKHSGEIQHGVRNEIIDREDVTELGTLLLNPNQDLRNKSTVFDSTGLAIQDTAAAYALKNQDVEPDTCFNFLN